MQLNGWRGSNRLVLVTGVTGTASAVVVNTFDGGFASAAAIGTATSGAVQRAGSAQTGASLEDLSLTSQDGVNLIASRDSSHITISGSDLEIDLTGAGGNDLTPLYMWDDNGNAGAPGMRAAPRSGLGSR